MPTAPIPPHVPRRAVLRLGAALPLLSLAAGAPRAFAQVAPLAGAGASFPSLVYTRWAAAYEKSSNQPVSYKPTGSGDGIKQISAHSVAFGGSDSPLTAEDLAKRKLVQIPMLVGGIVPVVNLPGVPEGRLQLTGELLADLMAGRIKTWHDARIAALNPGLALPALPVRRIVRADKSGTSEGFTKYLSAVSPAFAQEVGASAQPKWPGEVEAAEGNDGMAKALKAAAGTLAYVSYDRVRRDKLNGVKLRNAAGQWVAAGESGFRSAIANSDLSRKGDDLASLMDREGLESWPITMTSFVLIDAAPAKGADAGPVMSFLYWCFMHGDDLTRGTGFAPLPVTLQSKLAARFASVKPLDGNLPPYLGL
ncbi:MAG: phosphate ABC transporter substrate-binding protein PstS [Mitsuaria chitosanitabida]|uniref:phosphate ABC transporter substrate-binding protein PstS n=1 Tax=Roseateles chitosanitabidus TaxID=65048 RepID=UPI001B0DD3E7|nr:phosphate ABC transporter substrate-binding protein PstS [Roseateles chitosanitabidus]MBO9689318.1 phosphate ABC transporter substrate-binding protein PstS [Roseateles chitosanitabidus]